jgi:hypothetical protein
MQIVRDVAEAHVLRKPRPDLLRSMFLAIAKPDRAVLADIRIRWRSHNAAAHLSSVSLSGGVNASFLTACHAKVQSKSVTPTLASATSLRP